MSRHTLQVTVRFPLNTIDSTARLLAVMRRPQDLGREWKIPLCACFIDLQKAHDSVERNHVWEVLARFDMPQKIEVLLRQLQNGVWARMQTGNCECSERYEVKQGQLQGQRQGQAMSLFIVNVFLAAVLLIVLMCCSEDEDIIASLVQLEEDGVEGEKERIDRPQNVVWSMVRADDTGVVSMSTERLTKMTTVIVIVVEAAGLTMLENSTETMRFRTPQQGPKEKPLVVEAAGQKYTQTN